MPISDLQFTEWLSDPMAIRCTLIDASVNVAGVETTRYLSTVPYTMPDASIYYLPILNSGGVRTSEQLSETNSGLSVSDIEIQNANGEYDTWLNDVWANRRIIARIGDIRWDKADFRIIYDGIILGITGRGRSTLNLNMGDKLQRLNTPITEVTLGGSTANKDSILPLIFGEVHNISPLSTDPTQLEYMVANGLIERIIEVRDNGVVVPTTNTLGTGKFKLNATPRGTITCSIQGLKDTTSGNTYYNTIADIIKFIVIQYGKASTKFTLSDIDVANFFQFTSDNPQAVGIYINDRANVLSVCQELAESVGAQLTMSSTGLLRLIKFISPTDPSFTSTFDILESDIELNSLQISNVSDVSAAVKLNYCKNWTVQEELETGIPVEHKNMYALEWYNALSVDSTTITKYKLDQEPQAEDTLLLTQSDAANESSRRLELRKTQRLFYRFTGLPKLLQLQLGQQITIYNRRFGMSSGKPAIITRRDPDWKTGKVEMEIMI